MKLYLVSLLLFSFSTTNCGHAKPPVPNGYISCPTACKRTVELHCKISEDTCNKLCARTVINNNTFAACVDAANNCEQIQLCQ